MKGFWASSAANIHHKRSGLPKKSPTYNPFVAIIRYPIEKQSSSHIFPYCVEKDFGIHLNLSLHVLFKIWLPSLGYWCKKSSKGGATLVQQVLGPDEL
jgi:hypothetical protein